MLGALQSCGGTSRMMNSHPAVNNTGRSSHKEAQSKLSASFGGSNLHGPNKFKKRGKHFRK